MAHVHSDVPDTMLRELYDVSGHRVRFMNYDVVTKIGDCQVQPGVIPAPTGRPPAVAAAAAAAAADAFQKVAEASGGEGSGAAAASAMGEFHASGLLGPTVEVSSSWQACLIRVLSWRMRWINSFCPIDSPVLSSMCSICVRT